MSIVSLETFSQAHCYQSISALFPSCAAIMNFTEQPLRNYGHLNGQDIPCLLWNSQVFSRIHKSPPLIPILSSLNSLGTSWFKIRFNIVIPSAVRPLKHMLPLRFSNIKVYISHLLHAYCLYTQYSKNQVSNMIKVRNQKWCKHA